MLAVPAFKVVWGSGGVQGPLVWTPQSCRCVPPAPPAAALATPFRACVHSSIGSSQSALRIRLRTRLAEHVTAIGTVLLPHEQAELHAADMALNEVLELAHLRPA